VREDWIRRRAYAHWVDRLLGNMPGCLHCSELEDWLLAEREYEAMRGRRREAGSSRGKRDSRVDTYSE
jgi:hypothetical protein